MPVFYFLVILGVIALWFCLAFIFRPVGKLFTRVWKEAVNAMTEEDINKKEEEQVK